MLEVLCRERPFVLCGEDAAGEVVSELGDAIKRKRVMLALLHPAPANKLTEL